MKINTENIEIIRDSFGVPHIFTETDAEAAYGIAWVQCEDNFELMQENISIIRTESGKITGKEGAGLDFIAAIYDLEEFVDSRYQQDITPEVETLMKGYIQGLIDYADQHPDEIILKNYKPPNIKELLQAYTFNFLMITLSIADPAKLITNDMDLYETFGDMKPMGSNGMAFNSNKTSDGKSYLVANPHLPTIGPIRCYEMGVHSKEGLDVHGATFVGGGVTPMFGANQHLAWTHTTNFDDYSDVYKLEMHPTKKNLYKFDGEYLKLGKEVVKLKLKIGPIILPVSKKFYKSVYGPVIKNKDGYFAHRCNSFFNIKHIEQWYEMGRAKTYEEFWEALKIQGAPSQTITYADYQDNILHLNNALMPLRNENYEWRGIVPGNTSETLWSFEDAAPLEDLVQVKNPSSGYVYNSNNTPYDCTGPEDNPKVGDYPTSWGILETNTLRAVRFKELVNAKEKLSFQDIIDIRADVTYPSGSWNFRNVLNMDDVLLIAEKYPEFQEMNEILKKWNREMTVDNKQATIIALVTSYVEHELFKHFALYDNILPEDMIIKAFRYAKKFLKKNYGTLEVPLGDVQKLVRGDIELPMYGSPQTLANAHIEEYKKGKLKTVHGDTFIMFAQFGKDGLESIKSSNLYGSSERPDSPHYTDQMEMYTKRQLKDVELDYDKLKANAERIYHPGKDNQN